MFVVYCSVCSVPFSSQLVGEQSFLLQTGKKLGLAINHISVECFSGVKCKKLKIFTAAWQFSVHIRINMVQYLDKRNILNIRSALFVDVELSIHIERTLPEIGGKKYGCPLWLWCFAKVLL